MKFQRYLTEYKDEKKSVSKGLSKTNFLELLEQSKFKNSLEVYKNSQFRIFRGTNQHFVYGFYPKQEEERMSQNTGNFYTIMINHDAKWKKYPRRQIICSSSFKSANIFGTPFLLIPEYNTKIGCCYNPDIWGSFKAIGKYAIDGADVVDRIWKAFQNLAFVCRSVTKTRPEEVQEIINKISGDVDLFKINDIETLKWFFNGFDLLRPQTTQEMMLKRGMTKDWYDSGKSFYTWFSELLSPSKNGFKLQSFNESLNLKERQELWMDCECLMISTDQMKDIGL
jgi:hypothetical protein